MHVCLCVSELSCVSLAASETGCRTHTGSTAQDVLTPLLQSCLGLYKAGDRSFFARLCFVPDST